MFGIVFIAYAQLGLLLFGTKHPDFRNFMTSILTMIRMILGDFQYNLIEQANRVLGPIYFLTYILLVFFILLVNDETTLTPVTNILYSIEYVSGHHNGNIQHGQE